MTKSGYVICTNGESISFRCKLKVFPNSDCGKILSSGHIHLAELSEWWISRDATYGEARQSLADLASKLDRHRMCRGAGPKGRLPWESSAAIKGVTLAYPFKDAAAIVPEITCDKVCDEATGVALS